MADSAAKRVALFGRFFSGEGSAETAQERKEKLRASASSRKYEVIEEFWEEEASPHTPFDEREELQALMRAVWSQELKVDAVFLGDLAELGWEERHVQNTLLIFFEQNNLSIITYETTYSPEEWMVGYTL